jgi:hypothetical protein
MNVVLKENGEIRLEGMHLKKDIGVALVMSLREKLPDRPDRSSKAWCDWDTEHGFCDIYVFFPFAEWSKWLDAIKSDLEALNPNGYQSVKTQLEEM